MRRTSVAPLTPLEEEARRMSLHPQLAPVQENRHVSLKPPTGMEGRVKVGAQKTDAKARRASKAFVMRRDFMLSRRNTCDENEPDTPEPEEILDDQVLFSRLQRMFIAAEEDGTVKKKLYYSISPSD